MENIKLFKNSRKNSIKVVFANTEANIKEQLKKLKEVSPGEQELGVNKDGKENLFFSKRLEVPFNILKCIFLFYCVNKEEKNEELILN